MDYEKVKSLVDEGKSLTKIAEELGISRTTFHRMRKKDPKLNALVGGTHKMPNEPREIDYNLVTRLAGLDCTEYEIATAIGWSTQGFSKRKHNDARLREALDNGSIKGKISLRRSQMRSAQDRYLTICKECQKIYDGEFTASCVYCDAAEVDPKLRGPNGVHTKVKHKFVPGNVVAQIWLGKQILHQSDHVRVEEELSSSGLKEMREILKSQRGKRVDGLETVPADE